MRVFLKIAVTDLVFFSLLSPLFPLLLPSMLNAATISIAVCLTTQLVLPATAFSPTHVRYAVPAVSTTSTSLKLGDFFNFGKKDEASPAPVAEETKQDVDEEYYDEDDPIEKIFGVFFGKKEKNPLEWC